MRRQNIVLELTVTELLEEADCPHGLPGVGREGRRFDSEWLDSLVHVHRQSSQPCFLGGRLPGGVGTTSCP